VKRLLVVLGLVASTLPLSAGTALADPPGPTDYRTRVVEMEPPVEGFEVSVIGGDSFIHLASEGGLTIEVIGYGGEPYLRFLPDGTVQENERSPARYVNEDRYAVVDVPDTASARAEPVWQVVGTDGSYAWHDHRTHWMNPQHPPFAEPGDQILEGVIPLIVDGAEVDVTLVSVWEEMSFPWSVPLGAVLGLIAGVVVVRDGRLRAAAMATTALALAALAVSLVAFTSVPAETAPSVLLWIAPLMAAVLSVPAVRRPPDGATTDWNATAPTLLLISALELVIWAVVRWGWMFAAILPTDLPYWVDRGVVAMVMAGSPVILVGLVAHRVAGLRPASAG
jgi:hypothetical protein